MIFGRAAGSGPRTVALRSSRPGAVARGGRLGPSLGVVAGLLVVTACGSASPSSSPRSTGAVLGPAASAFPGSASGPIAAGPSAAGPSASVRRWVTKAITSMIALGAADTEIAKAGADLNAAVDAHDLKKMWGAADGLAKVIDKLEPDIDDLDAEPATQGIASIYHSAFPEISAGAKQLRDAITAGDAQGILAGTQRLLGGLNTYAPARQQLGDLVSQALVQQRLYLE